MNLKSIVLIFSVLAVFPSQAQDCNDLNFSIRQGPGNVYLVTSIPGATYLWSPTGSLQIVSGQGTSAVMVTGSGTLYVTRDHGNYHCYDSIEVEEIPPPNCVPTFHVMSYNWNSLGETCPNYALELGIINECPTAVDYQWSIMGATVTGNTPDNRYIFVRTSPNIGQFLTFRVRAVYANGTTSAWYTLNGITIQCGGGNIGLQQ